jgi:hypothetical protein
MPMSSIELSLLTFACIVAGIVLGSLLPGDKLNSDTKEAIRLGTGLIGTIAALVLGLLIASAKSSFDTQSGQIRQVTANIMLLDVFLKEYGPETADARRALRRQTASLVDHVWTRERSADATFDVSPEGLALYEQTQALKPATDAQRFLQTRALQLISDTAQTRVLLFTQGQNPIPLPFLAILVFWLTILFASFSMFARPGPVMIGTLGVFALSATGAIYLILELGRPFSGLLMIPSHPLAHALPPL